VFCLCDLLLGVEDERLLDECNSVNVNEPATLPGDTEVTDDGTVTNSDRLVENESSEVSFTDFTGTTKVGRNTDGYVDGEVVQPAVGSPETSAEDRNKVSSNRDDLIETPFAIKMESSESSGLLNNNGKGNDDELKSEDCAEVGDSSLVNKSTELDSIGVQEASVECNSSPVDSAIVTRSTDGPTDYNGPEHVDLSQVGTSPLRANDYWTE